MEEDDLPDLEIGIRSVGDDWRTSNPNVRPEISPIPIPSDILQKNEARSFEGAYKDEDLPDPTTGDSLRDDEIRILVLYPSDDDYNAPLRGRRERQRLLPDGPLSTERRSGGYDAVSYTWGTNVYGGSISIDGADLPIPLNLELALRKIRDWRNERRIWADAACINMADLIERGHQIFKIRKIFQCADMVSVWLGEETRNDIGLFPFMSRVARTSDVDDPVFGDAYDTQWQALQVLLMHPYFTRIWVVQELAFAHHIDIRLGYGRLYWKTFLKAIRASRARFAQRQNKLSLHVDSRVDKAISFVLNIDECSCLSKNGHVKLPVLVLEELVFRFSAAEASHPLDYIYGLLEVAADVDTWKSHGGFPNYDRSWEEVQKTFYMLCIKHSGSLDVIFRPWKWLQPSPWSSYQAEERVHTVSLVQAPGQTSPYNMFDGCHLNPMMRELTMITEDLIFTQGYLFDEVEAITDVHDNSNIAFPRSWLSEDFIDDAPKFARTLLASAMELEFDSSLDIAQCIRLLTEDSENGKDESTRLSELCKAFEDLYALTKGRRLFRSRRWSVKGLGPAHMRAGDLICFTPQCSVPVVLRMVENESRRYQVIGTCYVREYMSGQISDLLLEEKLSVIEFAVPFGADKSSSKIASAAAHIVNNDSTKEALNLARDSRTHISKASTDPSMVREVDVPYLARGFRMYWICTCGFKGLGHYIESRPGAINELATELQNGGYTVTLEPYNSFDIWNNFFDTAISQLQITAENFWNQYVTATLYTASRPVLAIKPADDLRNTRDSVPDGPKKTPALVPNTGSSGNARASASTSLALNQGTTTQSTSSPGISVPIQAVPVNSSQVTVPTSTNSSTVTIPPSGDFIHVCFKVKRYLKLRHDLPLTQVIKDRELFTNLREAYAANFSWAHRNLSIWTVQKINYVRFNQWERSEVTNLQRGVPPESERHYALKPNPRGYEPVLDNDHLMHRFTCSTNARCLDGSIGFEHIPKRIDRPEPWNHDEHPDLGIGWGLQLEEGCFHRLCIVVVGGVVVSAVIGVIWSAITRDVQSGFVVASWLLTSGTILVATIQLLVTLPSI